MKKILYSICLILVLMVTLQHGSYEAPISRQKRTGAPKISQPPKVSLCKTKIIAVIDTGFGIGWDGEGATHLCKYGHKDFTGGKSSLQFGTIDPVPVDEHGHGTHIAGLIDSYARKVNDSYCLVILKYYDPKANDNKNLQRTVEAVYYAKRIKADYINYSGGGISPSPNEEEAIENFIHGGGTFVAAAGNENEDLAYNSYCPAQYEGVIAVGNGTDEPHRVPTSNYGKRVNRWENGNNVVIFNHSMTGTSQAAAIATGKIVAEKNKSCK